MSKGRPVEFTTFSIVVKLTYFVYTIMYDIKVPKTFRVIKSVYT